MESQQPITPSVSEIIDLIDKNEYEGAHDLLRSYIGEGSRFDRELNDFIQLFSHIDELKDEKKYNEVEKFEAAARDGLRQFVNRVVAYEKLTLADNNLHQENFKDVFPKLHEISKGQPWNKEIDDLEKAYVALEKQHRNNTIDLKHFTK